MIQEYERAVRLRGSLDKGAWLKKQVLGIVDENAMSVISNYKKPLSVVHATMRAVLLLLGTSLQETEVHVLHVLKRLYYS